MFCWHFSVFWHFKTPKKNFFFQCFPIYFRYFPQFSVFQKNTEKNFQFQCFIFSASVKKFQWIFQSFSHTLQLKVFLCRWVSIFFIWILISSPQNLDVLSAVNKLLIFLYLYMILARVGQLLFTVIAITNKVSIIGYFPLKTSCNCKLLWKPEVPIYYTRLFFLSIS